MRDLMYISGITKAYILKICDPNQAAQRYTMNDSRLHISKCNAVTQGISKCAQ